MKYIFPFAQKADIIEAQTVTRMVKNEKTKDKYCTNLYYWNYHMLTFTPYLSYL